jgi:DNA-binding NtrC family response regulator
MRPHQPEPEFGEAYVQLAVGISLAEAERRLIVATLERCQGNKTRAATILGVSLKTLYNRINEYRALSD